ncbi:hypothetical protein BA768_12710 [Chryseobacterium sp. CBo1]|uniref:hypothetical protein n=1 Tax=Chryseobacterium sp. CBo1 TaxID=1869230 RepID=UPI000810E0E5|nr:hypothetical protein [Chryseobacterium sp. CBo1]OCK52443.1 hypothetical protein BA768_12710 [Chryseobacterium sp. CBo1]
MNCKSKNISTDKSSTVIEKISLSELTRGTNRIFTLTNGKLETSLNGNSKTEEITQDNWAKISEAAEKINLEGISKLESPSTKRYSDAAFASFITITKNGTEYQSSEFDAGNPPVELNNLYDEIKKVIETKKSK